MNNLCLGGRETEEKDCIFQRGHSRFFFGHGLDHQAQEEEGQEGGGVERLRRQTCDGGEAYRGGGQEEGQGPEEKKVKLRIFHSYYGMHMIRR